MPDQPARGPRSQAISNAPELAKFSGQYRIARLEAEMPSNVDNGIIGLMDPAHGPFGSPIVVVAQPPQHSGEAKDLRTDSLWLPDAGAFSLGNSGAYKLLRIYKEPITTTIDFVLPNHRLEIIRCGPYWFSSRAT